MANGHRVKHAREQKILKQIRHKKNRGWSNAKISDWLNTRGVRSPAGSIWYPATVGRILRSDLSWKMQYFQAVVILQGMLYWSLLEVENDKETIKELEEFSEWIKGTS